MSKTVDYILHIHTLPDDLAKAIGDSKDFLWDTVVRPDFSRQFLGFENTLLQRLLVSTCHCVCDAVLDYKTFQYNGISPA